MSLDKRVKILEVKITGDPLNNDDNGMKGDISHIVVVMNDVKKRLDDDDARRTKNNDRLWKWGVGFILFLSISACTYFINSIKDDNGNEIPIRSHSDSHYMDDHTKHGRGGKNDNNRTNRQHKNGD